MLSKLKVKLGEVEESLASVSHVKLTENDLKKLGLASDVSLRAYQLAGINWLRECQQRESGAILADEMGLGKTCQAISYLLHLLNVAPQSARILVICPLTVLENWNSEFSRFAPKVAVLCYHGNKDERQELQKLLCHHSIMLTTYEIVLADEAFFHKQGWRCVVVDEGHRLKNNESKLHRFLLQLDCHQNILLTGTPIQNNLNELYNLLSFVAPHIFHAHYREDFLQLDVAVESDLLHTIRELFMLRRIKSDVMADLPSKTEIVLYHGLSVIQKKLYKAILRKDIGAVVESDKPSSHRLMNILIQLRKCVAHPYLFDGIEPEPFEAGEHLVDSSYKLLLVDKLLTFLAERNHKVLMFSQMTRMLDVVQDYLALRGFSYERLDGSVRGQERFMAVQNFNKNEECFIFLLSTRAGGQGLNLVSADTIIFLDSDFNPQNDLQAAARAHRIGQRRNVKVIRLVGRKTVEELIMKRATSKLELTANVMEEGSKSALGDQGRELQEILKFGVESLFEDDRVDDSDFEKLLGKTEDGQWLDSPSQKIEEEKGREDVEEEEGGGGLYLFEGTDYKAAGEMAMQRLLAEEQKAELQPGMQRSKTQLLGDLLPLPLNKRAGKKLSPEEQEARRKKREENAEKRQKEKEEREKKRNADRRQKLEKKWEECHYASCKLELEERGEEEEEIEDRSVLQINYVQGDVTRPQENTREDTAIVVHCVDDSGSWGSGGIFSALSTISRGPEEQYQLAAEMEDLSLGDAHLIDFGERADDIPKIKVALLVAHTRDQKGGLTSVRLSSLSTALEKLSQEAKRLGASVHLPRIGYKTPNYNWYGTERLIRKYLACQAIPTYIYYFTRNSNRRRKRNGSETESDSKKRNIISPSSSENDSFNINNDADQSAAASVAKVAQAFGKVRGFEKMRVLLYDVVDEFARKARKFLTLNNSDIHTSLEDSTTHVLIDGKRVPGNLVEHLAEFPHVFPLSLEWLRECMEKDEFVDCSSFQLR